MWVRSEYAGELAVLSTWLCALSPWALTVGRPDTLPTTVWIFWFHPRRFLFLPGLELPGFSPPSPWVWEAGREGLYVGLTYAGWFWIVGSAVLGVAFALSVVYYFREEQVEQSRIDPVRTLGVLLVASGAALAFVFAALWQNHPGITVPIGVVFQFVLGTILIQTERIEGKQGTRD